ncbi:Hypothetical protein PHPALM_5808, partial [Phytophthora palmivora]
MWANNIDANTIVYRNPKFRGDAFVNPESGSPMGNRWSVIVTKAARMFTEWENWKTIEQFEKSMIRKLFLMDFLNYYTWFFLLAFV